MKNIFLKSTIILMIGTMFTKILSFIIRIIFTRIIKDGINLYALVMPTQQLLLTITSLGLTYSISAIMGKNNYKGIHVLASVIPIALIFNIIVIVITIIFAPFIADTLLKNHDAYLPILSIVFMLPFTSLSGIIKGYYFGRQNTLPNAISSIFEQIARLILLLIVIPIVIKRSIIAAVSTYIAISAVCEIVQIIVYLFFAPKNIKISLSDLKFNPGIASDVYKLSIPTVARTIIGNICYFLEPIILTHILLFIGYSSTFILSEYGTYNAYVIPILTAPGFIIMSINTTLIPEIAKNYHNHNHVKKRLRQCLTFSLMIGLIYCVFVYFNAEVILKLVYNTNKGVDYIKFLAIVFPLFYIEGPMVSTLLGLGLSKYTLKVTLISSMSKILTMTILSLFKIGIYGLIISEIINIFIVIILNWYKLIKLDYI